MIMAQGSDIVCNVEDVKDHVVTVVEDFHL